jgi:DNA-binding NarL/FixJ family response regulator
VIRVAVIASSPVTRAGLASLVGADPRFSIEPSGDSGGRNDADVLLAEIGSTDKALRALESTRLEAPAMVLLVEHLGRSQLRRLVQSGARAVLPNDANAAEILAAIEAVAAGLTVLRSEDMDLLLPHRIEDPAALPGEPLSAREMEVLSMLAEGLANKEIATRLQISEYTVKFHVSSILAKLGASSRGEAVMRGVREGLIVI